MATKVTLQLSWIFYLFFLCLLLGSGLAAGAIYSNFQHVLLPRAVDQETLDFPVGHCRMGELALLHTF